MVIDQKERYKGHRLLHDLLCDNRLGNHTGLIQTLVYMAYQHIQKIQIKLLVNLIKSILHLFLSFVDFIALPVLHR